MAAVAEKAIGSDEQFIHRQTPAVAETDREYQRDVNKLVDLLSQLNPSAKEFFPSYYAPSGGGHRKSDGRLSPDAPIFVVSTEYNYNNGVVSTNDNSKDSSNEGSENNLPNRKRRNGNNLGKRRITDMIDRAQREDSIRRTVYVSDIDQHVTEEKLADIFANYGQVVDCRICGDTHSVLRFAFIEFSDEDGARAALNLSGTILGYYPMRVLPSKTAILPVNPKFLPRSDNEKQMVVRTVYCTNIDKKVTQTDVKMFFEQLCGEVSHLRLLGDTAHPTRIAFVEFAQAESAILALNCSGMILGSLPIRVSPSKTPVRPRIPRAALQTDSSLS
ncbi:polyadenylate-binding protein-interacting protein 9 [Canna indica]|uniref:Polyadenylate-binding protein-interacting protein 9 n=1 Tax=Canna indica TaxID=4628 RepID=A0AAQ3JPK9_9LILI|nr:polyadenylate-binding protein-interacting protein 9 [Canna indica]